MKIIRILLHFGVTVAMCLHIAGCKRSQKQALTTVPAADATPTANGTAPTSDYGGEYGGTADYGSTDYGSLGSADYGSTGSADYGSLGSADYGSTGSADYGSLGSADYGSLGTPDYGSLGSADYSGAGLPPTDFGSTGGGETDFMAKLQSILAKDKPGGGAGGGLGGIFGKDGAEANP